MYIMCRIHYHYLVGMTCYKVIIYGLVICITGIYCISMLYLISMAIFSLIILNTLNL